MIISTGGKSKLFSLLHNISVGKIEPGGKTVKRINPKGILLEVVPKTSSKYKF